MIGKKITHTTYKVVSSFMKISNSKLSLCFQNLFFACTGGADTSRGEDTGASMGRTA
jgi:hypothetical protein